MTKSNKISRDWLIETLENEKNWPNGLLLESSEQKRMIQFWKEYCPKMYQELESQGIVKEFARYLDNKALDQAMKMECVMPPIDALEQAQRDWFIYTPEDDEEQELGEMEGTERQIVMWLRDWVYRGKLSKEEGAEYLETYLGPGFAEEHKHLLKEY